MTEPLPRQKNSAVTALKEKEKNGNQGIAVQLDEQIRCQASKAY
jgi:hypothetical protein